MPEFDVSGWQMYFKYFCLCAGVCGGLHGAGCVDAHVVSGQASGHAEPRAGHLNPKPSSETPLPALFISRFVSNRMWM